MSPTNAILKHATTNTRLPRSYHINKLKRIKDSNDKNVQGELVIRDESTVDADVEKTAVGIDIPELDRDESHDGGQPEVSGVGRNKSTVRIDDIIDQNEIMSENEEENDGGGIRTERTDSIIANAPTNSYMEDILDEQGAQEEADILYPVRKIHRKRFTPGGGMEYYVSWKDRPKRDNCWVTEDNLTDTLRAKADTLKLPLTRTRNI